MAVNWTCNILVQSHLPYHCTSIYCFTKFHVSLSLLFRWKLNSKYELKLWAGKHSEIIKCYSVICWSAQELTVSKRKFNQILDEIHLVKQWQNQELNRLTGSFEVHLHSFFLKLLKKSLEGKMTQKCYLKFTGRLLGFFLIFKMFINAQVGYYYQHLSLKYAFFVQKVKCANFLFVTSVGKNRTHQDSRWDSFWLLLGCNWKMNKSLQHFDCAVIINKHKWQSRINLLSWPFAVWLFVCFAVCFVGWKLDENGKLATYMSVFQLPWC